MTTDETVRFIDCVTYEDCVVDLHGKVYWCCGLAWDSDANEYNLLAYELNPANRDWIRDIFDYTSNTKDDCMKHFLEDKIWDGKSFYEVASEMEWIDL